MTSQRFDLLDNPQFLTDTFKKYIAEIGAHIVAQSLHKFDPQGVSGTFTLSESHLCFHSFPEKNYMSIDFFTCGDTNPEQCFDKLKMDFDAMLDITYIKRGLRNNDKYFSDVLYHKFYS